MNTSFSVTVIEGPDAVRDAVKEDFVIDGDVALHKLDGEIVRACGLIYDGGFGSNPDKAARLITDVSILFSSADKLRGLLTARHDMTGAPVILSIVVDRRIESVNGMIV